MAKIDLHLHSKYSEHPSEWFLQRLGAQESYTEPEHIYKTALARGMDFITITDHNRIEGALLLKEKYPDKVIVGMECTSYFPEDMCKIHLLLFGINMTQFEEIQKIRENIYQLRDYIKKHDIAYSIAHATFSINKKLKVEHLEKLMLMFDVFEGINSGRNDLFNNNWMRILAQLTPTHISMLKKKHNIEPISHNPWLKSFTGGSDDHGGLFIGNTYTEIPGQSTVEIIEFIKKKKTVPYGKHNNYQHLAFTIYKVAFEYAKNKKVNISHSFPLQISEKIFESESLNFRDKFKLKKLKSSNRKNGNKIGQSLVQLIEEIKAIELNDIEKRLDVVYKTIGDISDELFKKIIESVQKDIGRGDLASLIMNISSSLPGLFLSLPFLSTMKHMFKNRELIDQLQSSLKIELPSAKKKILWFTDTITDLNGVAETLKEMGWFSYKNNNNVKIVTSILDNDKDDRLPPDIIFLPIISQFNLPYNETTVIKIPSLLKSLAILSKEEPTEIYISTPGPIGLIGLLLARLFSIKAIGVYHTDFAREVESIAEDVAVTELVENYTRWFYSMMDTIKVPSKEYLTLLANRGLDRSKMQILIKGIDTNLFQVKTEKKAHLMYKYQIKDGINLLYAGRISKDKNLDFLIEIHRLLSKKRRDINLLIIGDGPYYNDLLEKASQSERIHFTGKIPREELPELYSSSDVFVFPSTTDTFGMVVLEAQACGLPSVVSDVGGPKEILVDGKTGYVAENNNLNDWIAKVEKLIEMKEKEPVNYAVIKECARLNVLDKFTWEKYFEGILGNGANN